jgi:XTP/dITP diphosphohydrolase
MTRVVLVAASPRFPLLFPPQTWRALDAAKPVYVLDDQHPSLPALEVGEIPWEVLPLAEDSGLAGRDLLLVGQGVDVESVTRARRQADALLALANERGSATLLLPPEQDGPPVRRPGPPASRRSGSAPPAAEGAPRRNLTGVLVQLVSDRAARQHIEVEAVYPLGEPKGSALLDLVATETRLRGPGGCPWDREQTHASLARHLIEEAYELVDAIDQPDPDPEHLREELGDLLLQVVFHAQIAEDAGQFDIDGVARAISEKLRRRHPHVFGDVQVTDADEVASNWERIKREQEGRDDPLAGIPAALPALQLAAKLQRKAASASPERGFGLPAPSVSEAKGRVQAALEAAARAGAEVGAGAAERPPEAVAAQRQQAVGELLFQVVALALALNVEPEAALRAASRRFRERLQPPSS